MSRPNKYSYQFEAFCLDPEERLLLLDGKPVPLTAKVFDTLVVLVKNAGHLVLKDELMKAIWPDSFVGEISLARNISELRKALGESAQDQRYIVTIPGRGYRFAAQVNGMTHPAREGSELVINSRSRVVVEGEREHAGSDHLSTVPATPSNWRLRLIVTSLVAAMVTAGVLAGVFLRNQRTARATAEIRSLAVLPLENLSGDPSQEYFSDGLTDELITSLTHLRNLRVISRTSIMHYKGARKLLPQIGRELGVDAVLEGTVARSGNRVRVRAELIRASTDEHIWAEAYESDLRDVLTLQSELARDIAREIRLKLSAEQQAQFATVRPVNAELHEAYLKGVYFFNDGRDHGGTKASGESFQKSVAYLQQAAQIDPNYAPAYAQLARTYDWMEPTPAGKSKAAARKALELDDTLAEAHGALAWELFRFDGEWAGAEREFKRAIELNPGYGEAHHGYALYLLLMRRFDEAITEINTALLLDPLTLPQKIHAARIYVCARQYDNATQQLRTTLTLNPNNLAAHLMLGKIFLAKAMYAEGVAEVQKDAQLSERSAVREAALAFAYAVSGRRAEASRLVAQLSNTSKGETAPAAADMAAAYAALGDKTRAFVWLEKAFEDNPSQMGWVLCFEPLSSMRSDPRMQRMLRRSGLPA
jgi:TolB-like protein/DNA-binding winged helix-turn-helix (wHTH) protein/Tfp pilus assembly protein PilF